MKGSQEAAHWSVGGCDKMKCSWCDGLEIFVLLDISLLMSSSWAGHCMGRQICTDEMLLMECVSTEWSHKRQKNIAAAVDHRVKLLVFWKLNLFERHRQFVGKGSRFYITNLQRILSQVVGGPWKPSESLHLLVLPLTVSLVCQCFWSLWKDSSELQFMFIPMSFFQ